jgi:hypothetical protein
MVAGVRPTLDPWEDMTHPPPHRGGRRAVSFLQRVRVVLVLGLALLGLAAVPPTATGARLGVGSASRLGQPWAAFACNPGLLPRPHAWGQIGRTASRSGGARVYSSKGQNKDFVTPTTSKVSGESQIMQIICCSG